VLQPAKPAADALLQWGVDSATNVAEVSTGNAIDGKGWALSDQQMVEAAVLGTVGALHNVKQRVAPEDAGAIHGLNPYFGSALKHVPMHPDGPSYVFGKFDNAAIDVAPRHVRVDIPDVAHRETNAIWRGAGRERLDAVMQVVQTEIGGTTDHVYRAFLHPLTNDTRYLRTEAEQPYPVSSAYQHGLHQLIGKAGFGEVMPPTLALRDETPVSVLPATKDDHHALAVLRAASAVGAYRSNVPLLAEHLRQDWQRSAPASQWMHHFAMGSGRIKEMNAEQVVEALPWPLKPLPAAAPDYVSEQTEVELATLGLAPSNALDAQIAAQRALGQTEGVVQGITGDHVFYAEASWANAIGSAHAFALYKGRWQEAGDGTVAFEGDRHWLVQDRYNWEAPDFNGEGRTAAAVGLPDEVVSFLPSSYQKSFDTRPVGHVQFGTPVMSDALFAHLQMVQGGAQPFWTIGLSDAKPVRSQWTPGSGE
jgi:hypothetical protein